MATPRAGPMNTPTQLAEEHHHVFRQISVGSYAHIYFSIPKITTNQILSEFDAKTIDQREACIRLRAALQAIKITQGKSNDTADNMDLEITVLTHIANKTHPNIVTLRAADANEKSKCWYTLELITGNTFGKYCDVLSSLRMSHTDLPSSLAPASFGWHLILQLTEALLALHFGDKGGKQSKRWPMYTHNDTHINNMLFRSGAAGEFKDYPDVVLIDFGRAKKLDCHTDRAAFFEAQRTDIKLVISSIVNYGFRLDQPLQDLWDEIRDLDIQKGADNNQVLKSWMRELRTRASCERERLYEPLHPDVVNHFQLQETMSNAELWEQSVFMRSVQQNGEAQPPVQP